jgi:zinc protease
MQHKTVLSITILALLISAGIVRAQTLAPSDVLPVDPQVTTGTLDNGMRYYIRHNAQPEKRVSVRLAVKAGSILESDNQQGLAHLVEHMAFNGTKKYPKNELVSFLETNGIRFGAHLNAYTSFDETVYMLELPTDKGDVLHKGIEILSEWAHNVTFDSVEIDKERGVVGEEWRLGLGANQRIEAKELPVLLKGSQYAERITIGQKAVIDTAHYETLRSFYRDWYRPDLMAIVIVGDVDSKQMLEEVKSLFGPIQNPISERTRTKFDVPAHSEPYVSVATDKELQFARFELEHLTPDVVTKTVGDYRHTLEQILADQMFNARMSEIEQTTKPSFVAAYSNESGGLGSTHAYDVDVTLKPDSLVAGIRALLREVYRVREFGFNASELERAKKGLLTGFENQYNEREKTNSGVLVNEYVRNFLHNEPIPGISYEYELAKQFVPGITLDEVNMHAQQRLEQGSVNMSLAAPAAAKTDVPNAQEILDLDSKVKREKLARFVDKTTNEALMAVLPKPGKIVAEKKLKAIGATEWKLSNGATVIVKPTNFKADEVLFTGQAPGGLSLAHEPALSSAQFATTIIDESGVGKFDGVTLTKLLTGRTVRVGTAISGLGQSIRGSSNAKELETMFQLAYLKFTAPRLDTNSEQNVLTKIRSFLQNRDLNPNTAFQDTLNAIMTQYNPRRKPVTVQTLSEIDPNSSLQFYKDRFNDAGVFQFFLVGNFDTTKMRHYVETYLASLPSSKTHESWRDEHVSPPTGIIEQKVYKGVEPKSSVNITITGPFDWSLQNRFNLQELAEVLSIKLREDLREDKSGVYGIGVSANPGRYPTPRYSVTVRFGCDPARVDELVNEVQKQLDVATVTAFDTTYIHKVQEIQRNELETQFKENNFWMGVFNTYHDFGEDPQQVMQRRAMIDALTPAAIQASAKKYLGRQNMVTVELFPEKKS